MFAKPVLDVSFPIVAFPDDVHEAKRFSCLVGNPGADEPKPHQFEEAIINGNLIECRATCEHLLEPIVAARHILFRIIWVAVSSSPSHIVSDYLGRR